MNFVGIIPSRYSSSRLPGKPLAMIGDKPMVQWVYENCKKTLAHVFVATDDQRIVDAVNAFGGKAVMTKDTHKSGTDRVAEAAQKIEEEFGLSVDVVINIQGDEPFFESEQISDIKSCFENPNVDIATLVQKVDNSELIFSRSEVKVALDTDNNALYFSRSPIPFVNNVEEENWVNSTIFYRHMGIYAYRHKVLKEIVKLPQSSLEITESLEQLRWLQNGFKVNCAITELEETMCIDTPEDLVKANEMIKGKP